MDKSLFQAVYMNDLDTVKRLLDKQKVNVNEKDRLGRSALQMLVILDSLRFAKNSLKREERLMKIASEELKMVGIDLGSVK